MNIRLSSLRARLLLAYAGLILVGFTILVLFSGNQISSGTVQDFTSGLEDQAQLLARALKEPVEHLMEGESNQSALQDVLLTYANQTNVEVVLVDGNGRFLASSTGSGSDTSVPEIVAALGGNIGTSTRDGAVYAAAPILEDGQVIGVVQLAALLSVAQSLIGQRWLGLAGIVLAVSAIAGIAAFWLATNLTRPMEQLRQASLKIAAGDFTQRLSEDRSDEIGEVARAFNQMSDQVEAMIEEQHAFASNASHELRTPLTAIRLRSEALRDNAVDGELARQYIIDIDDEVQRLGNLVQELILISRLETGRLQTGHEKIDCLRLARQLMAEVQAEAESRHIVLTLDAPQAGPVIIAGQVHVSIVFRNLLSNALKYSPDGGQIVWQIKPENNAVLHTIRDSGQGIAPDDLPRLFERFYRADRSRSRSVPGVGLGLSLVKLIVEYYGGTVWLESSGVQQGTSAFVRWPVNNAIGESSGRL